jgi:hypothetical protein
MSALTGRAAGPRPRAGRFTGLLAAGMLALAIVGLLLGLGAGRAQARFQLGLQDDGFGPDGTSAQAGSAYGAMQAIHGSYVRIALQWSDVVESNNSPKPPPGFDQANPGDSHYGWTRIDAQVLAAAQHHLHPILAIDRTPTWGSGPGPVKQYTGEGAWNPIVSEYSQFVHAAARRYSGSFPDPNRPGSSLPRVRYWEPWNEPNIPGYLNAPNTGGEYRSLLGAAYGQLKSVHRDNVVLLGGLAPVSPVPGSIPPLKFAADLICLRSAGSGYAAIRSCRRASFDAVAVHPYSIAATPTKRAYKRGDLLMGDMGELRSLVQAANRTGHTNYPIWVTEFSWYTNPPDTQIGDAPNTAARYVAYSMYEMWKAGVSVVIWFKVLDPSGNDTYSGGGLDYASGQPKPSRDALAFPMVAGVGRGRGFAWGRVPTSGPKTVVVERQAGRRWVRVASVRTGAGGVFYARFGARGNAVYRARALGGPTSLPYDSRPIPPRRTHLFNVF